MRKAFIIPVLILALLTLPAFAVIGKTVQTFTDSDYAKSLELKVQNMQPPNPDLTVYIGKGNQMIVLKSKKDAIFYERLTWISLTMPKDENIRQAEYIRFLMQAAEIKEGTPDYDLLVKSIQGKLTDFTLKSYFVRLKNQPSPNGKGDKFVLEISTSKLK